MKTIVISYDEEIKRANIYNTEDGCYSWFDWDDSFEIVGETPDTDCEDFNDNARWIMKTLLAILKMEQDDTLAHCDWSADYDKNRDTGKYKFKVRLTKVGEKK